MHVAVQGDFGTGLGTAEYQRIAIDGKREFDSQGLDVLVPSYCLIKRCAERCCSKKCICNAFEHCGLAALVASTKKCYTIRKVQC